MLEEVLSGRRADVVRVLDVDAGLAEALGPHAAAAADHLVARVLHVPRERWLPLEDPRVPEGGFGLLVLEGLLVRRVELAGRSGAELLGPGDLLRPRPAAESSVVPGDVSFRVLSPARLAVLDRPFTARAARWPDVAGELMGRLMSRVRGLAGRLALLQVPRVEVRLLGVFWQLAERWGTVSREGVIVPVRLSHELLGEIVGARRPTVTTALSMLAERGEIVRRRDRTWLITGPPPGDLER
jgi:CRP-like cAMP-binding protein